MDDAPAGEPAVGPAMVGSGLSSPGDTKATHGDTAGTLPATATTSGIAQRYKDVQEAFSVNSSGVFVKWLIGCQDDRNAWH